MIRFEPFLDRSGAWRYRLVAANGQIAMTSGESFASRSNALRAARRVRELAPAAAIADENVIAALSVIAAERRGQEAQRRKLITGLVRRLPT